MIRLEMRNYNIVLTEKLQKSALSALSSGKIDKYEQLTGQETLPFNQSQIIEQTKFNSPLEKAFEQQRKTIEDATESQTMDL